MTVLLGFEVLKIEVEDYLKSNPLFPLRLLGIWPVRLLFCKNLEQRKSVKS